MTNHYIYFYTFSNLIMSKDFLQQTYFSLSKTSELRILPLDNKCASLYIEIKQKDLITNQISIYAQTINSSDFQSSQSNNKCFSILFVKLALQQFGINVEYVTNLVWEKVIMGKDKIEAAKQYMLKTNNSKKYSGVVLDLSSPQHFIIILPKIVDPHSLPKLKSYIAVENDKEKKIKQVFFKKEEIFQEPSIQVKLQI